MPYPKTYKVVGPVVLFGAKTGEKFTLDNPPMWKHDPTRLAVDEHAWLEAGLVELVEETKLACEQCEEHGTAKDKKKRYSPEELVAHYVKEHPGFEPPREG